MAKMTPRPTKGIGSHRIKRIATTITVSRVASGHPAFVGGHRVRHKPSRAFVACVQFKTGGFVKLRPGYEPAKLHGACGFGPNPRKAIASALLKASRSVVARSGAYAGYRRRGRR